MRRLWHWVCTTEYGELVVLLYLAVCLAVVLLGAVVWSAL